jgi:tRNA pseudouridine13 synthase
VLEGDLAMKHANRAVFLVADAKAEQPRAEAFEISPTGPLFGSRMTQPQGPVAAIEAEVLTASGLAAQQFAKRAAERIDGARRALRVRPENVQAAVGEDGHGRFVGLEFGLPSGSYATALLREVCKTPSSPNKP